VQLQVPYDAAASGSHPIQFHIEAWPAAGPSSGSSLGQLSEKTVFLIPR
jgi:hypothetical protein